MSFKQGTNNTFVFTNISSQPIVFRPTGSQPRLRSCLVSEPKAFIIWKTKNLMLIVEFVSCKNVIYWTIITQKRTHICCIIASENLAEVMQTLVYANKLTKSPFRFCYWRSNLLRISAIFIKIKWKGPPKPLMLQWQGTLVSPKKPGKGSITGPHLESITPLSLWARGVGGAIPMGILPLVSSI